MTLNCVEVTIDNNANKCLFFEYLVSLTTIIFFPYNRPICFQNPDLILLRLFPHHSTEHSFKIPQKKINGKMVKGW